MWHRYANGAAVMPGCNDTPAEQQISKYVKIKDVHVGFSRLSLRALCSEVESTAKKDKSTSET